MQIDARLPFTVTLCHEFIYAAFCAAGVFGIWAVMLGLAVHCPALPASQGQPTSHHPPSFTALSAGDLAFRLLEQNLRLAAYSCYCNPLVSNAVAVSSLQKKASVRLLPEEYHAFKRKAGVQHMALQTCAPLLDPWRQSGARVSAWCLHREGQIKISFILLQCLTRVGQTTVSIHLAAMLLEFASAGHTGSQGAAGMQAERTDSVQGRGGYRS